MWAIACWSRLGVGKVILADACQQAAGRFQTRMRTRRLSFPTSTPMAQRKHEPSPPMGPRQYARAREVHHLIAYCLNNACRHQAIIDVSSYPGDTLVPWFRSEVKCAKCGARNNRIDVRPNWKEAPGMPTKLRFD